MYIIQRVPTGVMAPPFLKHWIHKPKAKPPQAPIKYFVPFQKNILRAPPMIPDIAHARTNMPCSVLFGGFMAGRIPNFAMRTKQTREKV